MLTHPGGSSASEIKALALARDRLNLPPHKLKAPRSWQLDNPDGKRRALLLLQRTLWPATMPLAEGSMGILSRTSIMPGRSTSPGTSLKAGFLLSQTELFTPTGTEEKVPLPVPHTYRTLEIL